MRRETGVLELEQCQVSGYEVAVQRLVWFPLLNRIHTPSCRELYQRWLVWAWTLSLSLGGQSKPAIDGHLKTGQRKEHSGH